MVPVNDDIYGQVKAGDMAGILSPYWVKGLADDHQYERPAKHPGTIPAPH
ncbi:hypothetical protein MTHERMOG20_01630 [Moorella thermoacetica]|nr:hypothetical protein MTHERMOG20_01630 [Moorella thermoacetica]